MVFGFIVISIRLKLPTQVQGPRGDRGSRLGAVPGAWNVQVMANAPRANANQQKEFEKDYFYFNALRASRFRFRAFSFSYKRA